MTGPLKTTLASDQNQHPAMLSDTSRKMLQLRDKIFTEWEKRVRTSVKETSTLRRPILVDTLPAYYDNIAESLTDGYRVDALDAATLATEHGGERARLTHYDTQALIREYQIFRSTIFDVFRLNHLHLKEEEIHIINASVDNAIGEAMTGFALMHTALREQYIATLTHDMRNPLHIASMAAELIFRTSDNPQIKSLANRIIENHSRMDRMINDLLDTAVFQSGERLRLELSFFDVRKMIDEIYDEYTSAYGERFQISGNSVEGWWDRKALRRGVENILSNAVKYGNGCSMIRIQVGCFHERLMLSVHNIGCPIPPEEMEAIFQIYRRAEAAKTKGKSGWGIGLPYVRAVAEGHGGSVAVDSSIERGTTFTIDIPVDARPFIDAPTSGMI